MPVFAIIIIAYLGMVSLVAVVLTAADKHRARTHKRRVPERTLLAVAALGGSIAEWLTMLLIRHKTLHTKFMVGLPLMMIAQVIVAAVLYRCLVLS